MRRAAIGLVLTAIGATAAVAIAGFGSVAPRDAIMSANGKEIRVDVGTYCISSEPDEDGEGVGQCADVFFVTEPPRPRLRVAGGDVISMNLPDNPRAQDDPKQVSASLVKVTEEGPRFLPGRVAISSTDVVPRRDWSLELPDNLRTANAVDIFVRYAEGGDAFYLAGLRPTGR